MRRCKLSIVALMGVLILTAMAFTVVSSAALPEILPEGTATEPVHFNFVQDSTSTIETLSGKIISCTKLSGKSLVEKLKLGKFELLLEGCETEKTPCTGLNKGEESGKIAAKGDFHSWYGLLGKKLVNSLVFLPEHTHFTCGFGLVLVLVLGCIAGEVLGKLSELLKTVDLHFLREKGTKGDPDIPEVLNDEGKFIKCQLSISVNEGTEESFSIEQLWLLKEFTKLIKGVPTNITALLMY